MLKKISCSDLRLGMFVHAFEGSWFDHPFWKSRFLLEDARDLAAIRKSGLPSCWIDLSRGCGPVQSTPAQPLATSPSSVVAAMLPSGSPVAAMGDPSPADGPPSGAQSADESSLRPRTETAAEVERAASLIGRFRGTMSSLFEQARLGKALQVSQVMPVVEEISDSVQRNSAALISLARLRSKDDYTYMHSVSVCALMIALARQLGLDETQTREAGIAGMLHDIGKMAIPLAILNKPGALSDGEFAQIRLHPERGHAILQQSSGIGQAALDVCLHHHEKTDGSGYPHGLAGETISLMARMGAVCDVYDAITSARAYKKAWEPSAAIQRMSQWKGSFDETIFQAFVRSIGIYPVGTLVRLRSDRLAVVIDHDSGNLLRPRVKVFHAANTDRPLPISVLDLASASVDDAIVARESPADWGWGGLEELWKGSASLG